MDNAGVAFNTNVSRRYEICARGDSHKNSFALPAKAAPRHAGTFCTISRDVIASFGLLNSSANDSRYL